MSELTIGLRKHYVMGKGLRYTLSLYDDDHRDMPTEVLHKRITRAQYNHWHKLLCSTHRTLKLTTMPNHLYFTIQVP